MRKSPLELFKEHYPKYADEIRIFSARGVEGTNLSEFVNHPQLSDLTFVAEIIPESLDGYFRGMFSYRYKMGIEFRLILIFPQYFGADVRVDCGVWRAWRWHFFIPLASPEGKVIAGEEERVSDEATAADMAD